MINFRKFTFFSVVCVMALSFSCAVAGQEESVFTDTPGEGDFALVAGGAAATLVVDDADYKVVRIAAEDLAEDIEAVTGVKPETARPEAVGSGNSVIIGVLGKSGLIDELAAAGKLDVSAIDGRWESFIISVVDEKTLVIAGSDRRGAAFGVYELARQAGVNPWNWWADVPAKKQENLFVKAGAYKFGPPSVKYRGIFLNDEDFGLKPWAAKTFEPEVGDIGPKTYARIFELLLRLKANYLWPAMHNCTKAFNYYPENKVVADDYAIVMGASHCEQMLRNNVDEWDHDTRGTWDWTLNRDSMTRYWEERVRENGKYENIYTIGLRGVHDSPMEGGGTLDERTERMTDIFDAQRGLLKKYVNEDPSKVPQVFCPYKEVLEIYRNDLEVPEDVTLLWVDDNFGYIRQLSTPEEQARPGGSGVYYHISYWGPPHDYLWLNTTPPALIWVEMKKAYDYNARDVWVLNVGDIKPGEIGMDFFLRMGWDIDRWTLDTLPGFLEVWCREAFGGEYAAEIADILNRYYILNFQRKPEHMGFYQKYTLTQIVQNPEFSLYNYGDEATRRMDAFSKLREDTEKISEIIPGEYRDAYKQLVLYPVLGSALINDKLISSYKSREYKIRKRAAAGLYAKRAEKALAGIITATDAYNNTAGGKWMLMMDYKPNDLPVFTMPPVKKIKPEGAPSLGIAVEGMKRAVREPGDSEKIRMPAFNRFTRKKYFVDLFNIGAGEIEWTAGAVDDWILLSEKSGSFELEQRVWIEIDYDSAPAGKVSGSIVFRGAGSEYEVKILVLNPTEMKIAPGTFIDDNGVISIYAESFSVNKPGGDLAWTKIPGLGRTGNAMALLPFTAPSVAEDRIIETAPVMETPIYVFSGGAAKIIVNAVPTHEIHKGRFLKCAVSVDGGEPVIIEFEQSLNKEAEVWKENVLRNAMTGAASLEIPVGAHTLKLWGMDPSVIVDNILIDFGGLRKSYLGPEETRAVEN